MSGAPYIIISNSDLLNSLTDFDRSMLKCFAIAKNISQLYPFLDEAPGIYIPPSKIEMSSSKISLFSSTSNFFPIPLHSGQAPKGALKENNLGISSGILISSWSGQA